MEPKDYIVSKIEGEYVYLKDIECLAIDDIL